MKKTILKLISKILFFVSLGYFSFTMSACGDRIYVMPQPVRNAPESTNQVN